MRRIVHISTDEVYGEVLTGAVDETALLNPTNPYSASKAAAEMIVGGYIHSFNLPVIMIRANNVFGVRQYPEKLIPRCCLSLIKGEKIPLHGNGQNVRHYLAARDLASAVELVARVGKNHETYNIGSPDEFSNTEVATAICAAFGVSFEDHVEFVQDRPFNDRRYAVVWDKITALGWCPKHSLKDEVEELAAWYRLNYKRYV